MNYIEACKILEVSPDDSLETIKKCYLSKVKFYHPDNHQGDAQQTDYAERMTKKINEAWEYIRNNYNSRSQEEHQETSDDNVIYQNDYSATNYTNSSTSTEYDYQYTYTVPVYEPIFTSKAIIIFSVIVFFIFSLFAPFLPSCIGEIKESVSSGNNISDNGSSGAHGASQYSEEDKELLKIYNFKEVNNGYAVSAKHKKLSGKITLPSVFNGKRVIKIDDGGFEDCTSIVEVTIPDSIMYIGENAFEGCSALKKITIPDSVVTIGKYAFSECKLLSDVTIPNFITVIPNGIFYNCISLSSILIPNSVETIERATFEGCVALREIGIPDSVKRIDGYAFKDCISLTKVSVPATVEVLDSYSFKDCIGLKEIEIKTDKTTPDNLTWPAFPGCKNVEKVTVTSEWLKNIDNLSPTILVVTNTKGNFNIWQFRSIISVTFEEGIEIIKSKEFYNCEVLKEVHLPNTVKIIESKIFYNCREISDVYYDGTMEQWLLIQIDSEWNSSQNAITVHCLDGEIEYTK